MTINRRALMASLPFVSVARNPVMAQLDLTPTGSPYPRGNAGRNGQQISEDLGYQRHVAWLADVEGDGEISDPVVGLDIVCVRSGSLVSCIDRWTGSLLWKSEASSHDSTPVLHINSLLVNGSNSIFSFNALTGTLEWEHDFGEPVAYFCSPTIEDGKVIVHTANTSVNNSKGWVTALNSRDGDVVWEYETNGHGAHSSACGGGLVFIQADDRDLIALELENGEKRWENDSPTTDYSPIYIDGRVLAISPSGQFLVADASSGAEIWAKQLFDYREDGFGFSRGPYAAVSGQSIYMVNGNQQLVAVNIATGEIEWVSNGLSGLDNNPSCTNIGIYVGLDERSRIDQADLTVTLYDYSGRSLWSAGAFTPTTNPELVTTNSSIVVAIEQLFVAGPAGNQGNWLCCFSL